MKVHQYLKQIKIDAFYESRDVIFKEFVILDLTRRFINQLSYFEDIDLNGVKVADVGCGVGIATNYFKWRGANVVGFEPDTNNYNSSRKIFPDLTVVNGMFDKNKYDIITLFGVRQFISKSSDVDDMFTNCRLLVIDNAYEIPEQYSVDLRKKYFCPISKKFRQFTVYKNHDFTQV